jgi:hypothetical protein
VQDIDITSYHPGQRTWAWTKDRRPEILFQYKKSGHSNPTHLITYLIDPYGRVVIDEENHPVRHFDVLPLTISTEVEGWRLEAWMRIDDRIRYNDIRARMLIRDTSMRAGKRSQIAPLPNTMQMRRLRARGRGRCLAWKPSNKPTNFDALLDAEMTSGMKAANTTRFLEDLTSEEFKALNETSYGTRFVRAGDNAISPSERDRRWQSASSLADKPGQIPTEADIDTEKFHLGWKIVRTLQFPMVLPKADGEIPVTASESQAPSPTPVQYASQTTFPHPTQVLPSRELPVLGTSDSASSTYSPDVFDAPQLHFGCPLLGGIPASRPSQPLWNTNIEVNPGQPSAANLWNDPQNRGINDPDGLADIITFNGGISENYSDFSAQYDPRIDPVLQGSYQAVPGAHDSGYSSEESSSCNKTPVHSKKRGHQLIQGNDNATDLYAIAPYESGLVPTASDTTYPNRGIQNIETASLQKQPRMLPDSDHKYGVEKGEKTQLVSFFTEILGHLHRS